MPKYEYSFWMRVWLCLIGYYDTVAIQRGKDDVVKELSKFANLLSIASNEKEYASILEEMRKRIKELSD